MKLYFKSLTKEQSHLIANDYRYLIGSPFHPDWDFLTVDEIYVSSSDGIEWHVYVRAYWKETNRSMLDYLHEYLNTNHIAFSPDKYGLALEE